MTSPDLDPMEKRVADRISDDLYRARAIMPSPSSVSIDELHVLETGWEFTADPAHLEGQRTSWAVSLVRRMLLRLLFPSLKQQSIHAKVTSAVLLDVLHRLASIERTLHEIAQAQPDPRRSQRRANEQGNAPYPLPRGGDTRRA